MNWRLVALSVLVAVFWGSIGLSAPTGTLTVAVETDAVTADPHVNIYNYSLRLQRGPYEPLVLVDQTGAVVPRLAESWEVSEDGLTYTFHLRPHVFFSDGTPFNAEAVKYNVERCLGLGLHGATYLPKRMIAEVVDELTVQFVLEAPYAPFVRSLETLLMISPTAAQLHEEDGDYGQKWLDRHAVGTGPYLLETWVKDQYYKLTYNPNYWRGWDGSHYAEIIVRIVPEETTRVQLLLRGEVDAALGIQDDAFLKMLEANPNIDVVRQPTGEVLYIRMKNRGFLKDPKVRQAMLYIFPYTAFWQEVQRGRGSVAHGFIAPAVFGYDETIPELHQDLARAKALLAEAGYANGFSVEMWIFSSFLPIEKPLAELFKEAAAQAGIEVKIRDIASAATFLGGVYAQDVNEGPDMFVWTQAPGINSPLEAPLGMWYSLNTPPGRNAEHYSNSVYDDLYIQASRTLDEAERAAIYSKMQWLLLEDPPAVPIGIWDRYVCAKRTVQNLNLNIAGIIIDWYDVKSVESS